MKLLLAPDKFRGTLTAQEAARVLGERFTDLGHEVRELPLADGGEGTLEALGGANRTDVVEGPLGDPVEAGWRLRRGKAVIEMAAASGIALVGGAEGNHAADATSKGTGQLIHKAIDLGAKEIVVGVGGSASTDGGSGAVMALEPAKMTTIGVSITVACDVRIPFLDAAAIFAPQKGATEAQVELLARRLRKLRHSYEAEYEVDVNEIEGSGAGGGFAGGMAAIGADLVGGFDLIVEALRFDEHLDWADAVVTGEGILDAESFDGKTVGGIQEMANELDTPVVAVVGDYFDGTETRIPAISLVETYGEAVALDDAARCLRDSAESILELLG